MEHSRAQNCIRLAQILMIIVFETGNSATDNIPTLQYVSNYNDCTCPGDVLTYECRVVGVGATVWLGTIFNCSSKNNQIILRHNRFTNGIISYCNDGDVVAYTKTVFNNTYISQLNVTVTSTDNQTVECVHDNGTVKIIGSFSVSTTSEPYPPPKDIYLTNISQEELVFNWNPPVKRCSAITYHITTSKCGVCPEFTNSTMSICKNVNITGNNCSFAVQPIVCGDNIGQRSLPLISFLSVPSALYMEVAAVELQNKTMIIAAFKRKDTSNQINGSTVSYTITYSDIKSNNICDSVIISTSSYDEIPQNGIYSYVFQELLRPCTNARLIKVEIFATNLLGDGPKSEVMISLNDHGKPKFELDNNGEPNCIASIAVGSVSWLLLILWTILLISIIVYLAKSKARIQQMLNIATSTDKESTTINTEENVAYDHIHVHFIR